LKAEKKIKNEPFAVLFGDDIVHSQKPCLKQLMEVFQKTKKSVLALYKISEEKISSYGVVEIKNKLEEKLYEIKNIIEKPGPEQAPSNLAIVGKYILTPNIFFYLRKIKGSIKNEVILANALKNMLNDGDQITGLEFEGKWLECGNKVSFIKSNIYLSKKHSLFGKEINDFISAEKNL
jgi:UTP--glucose-1-phosphate uridylyltransferase